MGRFVENLRCTYSIVDVHPVMAIDTPVCWKPESQIAMLSRKSRRGLHLTTTTFLLLWDDFGGESRGLHPIFPGVVAVISRIAVRIRVSHRASSMRDGSTVSIDIGALWITRRQDTVSRDHRGVSGVTILFPFFVMGVVSFCTVTLTVVSFDVLVMFTL